MRRIVSTMCGMSLVCACACSASEGSGGPSGVGGGGHGGGESGGASSGGTGGGVGGLSAGGTQAGGSGGQTAGGTASGGAPPAGSPVVTLSTDVRTLTEGQSVTFTALVSDADGAQDLVGGTLADAAGTNTFGPFASASPGAFSLTLDWAKIGQVQSIEFQGQDARTFAADFVDREGHHGGATTIVTLTCAAGAACAGKCVDLMTDEGHCGACNKACSAGATCSAGSCPPRLGECISQASGFATCDAYCASVGRVCVDRGCSGDTALGYASQTGCNSMNATGAVLGACNEQLVWAPSSDPVKRCCCS